MLAWAILLVLLASVYYPLSLLRAEPQAITFPKASG